MAEYALSIYCIPGLFQAPAAENAGGAERKVILSIVGVGGKFAECHKDPTPELNFEGRVRVWSDNRTKDKRGWMWTFSGKIHKTSN